MKKAKNEQLDAFPESEAVKEAREKLATRPPVPTPQELRKWAENDLKCAVSFLHLIMDNPKAFDQLCETLYQHSVDQEKQIVEQLEAIIKAG